MWLNIHSIIIFLFVNASLLWLACAVRFGYYADMKYIATTKVQGGKLLRVKCEAEQGDDAAARGTISNVSITGDFFMHPEDGVTELEKSLEGMSARAEVREYVSKLNDAIHGNEYELIGFSASDIAETLIRALREGATIEEVAAEEVTTSVDQTPQVSIPVEGSDDELDDEQ